MSTTTLTIKLKKLKIKFNFYLFNLFIILATTNMFFLN